MIDEKTKKKAIEAAADIYGWCLFIVSFSLWSLKTFSFDLFNCCPFEQ